MDTSAFDVPALLITILIAVAIAAGLLHSDRGRNTRRVWLTAGVLWLLFSAIGVIDLALSDPRETHFTTVLVGLAIPVLGTLGIVLGTRPTRRWIRWAVTVLTAFVLLVGGLQLGATVASRFLPF